MPHHCHVFVAPSRYNGFVFILIPTSFTLIVLKDTELSLVWSKASN
ncbi:hypothetical protein HMPREF6485_1556 [Segatella buccae ATCC 33574]|uniref:Uncharacterized protein n=1 Tax=Segatella buccae ATCC 33574 TaxID=873513 RepID=E6K7X7_9BACT|nr:hypothetical protein HMPREF6485_1556 [Segatella buccae ATCC 33574]